MNNQYKENIHSFHSVMEETFNKQTALCHKMQNKLVNILNVTENKGVLQEKNMNKGNNQYIEQNNELRGLVIELSDSINNKHGQLQ